jgi:hypothetical protein
MRKTAFFQVLRVLGVLLGALIFVGSLILDWSGVEGKGFNWRLGLSIGSGLFAAIMVYEVLSRDQRIASLESVRPSPRVQLIPIGREYFLDICNEGEVAEFEAQVEFTRYSHIDSSVFLPSGSTQVQWVNDSGSVASVRIPRGGHERIQLTQRRIKSSVGDKHTYELMLFPRTYFLVTANSWKYFTIPETSEEPIGAVYANITIITTPSVPGMLISRCYRVGANGMVSEIPCDES